MKFRQSFQFYLANQQRPMVIACEYLIQDCHAFSKFNKEFTTFVAELNEKAVNVITECVQTGIGIQNFETAQREREKHKQRIKLEADKVQYAFKLQTLAEDQRVGQAQMAEYRAQISRIQNQ